MTPFMISVLGISIPFLLLMIYGLYREGKDDESTRDD